MKISQAKRNKITKSEKKSFLSTLIMSLVLMFIVNLLFWQLPIILAPSAKALLNYNRIDPTELVTMDQWNALDVDFVTTEGGAMSADLNMDGSGSFANRIIGVPTPTDPGHLANVEYVNNALLATKLPVDSSGNPLGIICDWFTPGLAGPNRWRQDNIYTVSATIPTNTGFLGTPLYFASLTGAYVYVTYGINSVQNESSNGFDVKITYHGEDGRHEVGHLPGNPTITPDIIINEGWNWTVYWCAIGN